MDLLSKVTFDLRFSLSTITCERNMTDQTCFSHHLHHVSVFSHSRGVALKHSQRGQKEENHHRGHGVTSGMNCLICPAQRSVSVCPICAMESQHTTVYLLSSWDLPAASCLFTPMLSWLPHTHQRPQTRGQRMNGAHVARVT